jgi:tetratricopeptide (TPR) repeat protein
MVYGFFGLLWILSRRDDRFANAVEQKTVKLFVAWFFFCIALTAMHIYSAGNVAHGVGAILGVLTGVAISQPRHRATATVSIGAILLFGLWGSTLGRPRINLSGKAGYEEAKWGYDALMANRNRDAARWFGDAVIYQPKSPSLWFDLGIAYQRLGNKTSAQAAYENAHQLDPNETKYSQALTALN